jgi:tetratricopeptide (TPR) repeat protein
MDAAVFRPLFTDNPVMDASGPTRLPPAAVPSRPEPSRFRNLWQLPVFLLGLTALMAVWITRPWWHDPRARQFEQALESARAALDQGDTSSVNQSLLLLTEQLSELGWFPGHAGEFHFLLGSLYLRQADKLGGPAAEQMLGQALEHLRQAEVRGVPEADRARLAFRLSKALDRTGGEPDKLTYYLAPETILSLPADQPGEGRFEAYGMLARAYLKLNNRQAALEANERQLQLPILDQDALLAPARLLRGELLWKQDRIEARKVLARISPDAPPAILSPARFLLALGYQLDNSWAEAANLWNRLLNEDPQPAAPRPQILFYLGWCYRHLERSKEAVQIWQQLVGSKGEESQAASLRLGELRLEAGARTEALGLYERGLTSITRPDQYHNRLVTLAQARQLLTGGAQACLQAGAFSEGLRFLELYGRIGNPDETLVLRSTALETWALAEQKEAAAARDPASARQKEEAARKHLDEAASAYGEAAEQSTDPSTRAERLWHAGQDYLQARDFASALKKVERYLQLAPSSEHVGEAYYQIGQAYQALNQRDAAGKAYRECIGLEKLEPIPKSRPFTFRARYRLALLVLGEGKRGDAEEMLRQNLELMRQGPDPEAEEESLFTLAELLFLEKNYSEASSLYDEALRRYPGYADHAEARFRFAECYRHLAEQALQSQRNSHFREMREHWRHQCRFYLQCALANYEKLVTDLETKSAGTSLSSSEKEVLELSRVAKAQCLFNLGEFRVAIPLYHDLANRYRGSVEGLLALQQQWFCYFQSGDPQGAIQTLTSMRLFLEAMDDKAFERRPPNQSREAFKEMIKQDEAETEKLSLTP